MTSIVRPGVAGWRAVKLAMATLAMLAALSGVAGAQTASLTASPSTLNAAGGTITFTFSATFAGTAIVGFDVSAPAAWTYQSGTGEPAIKPAVGTSGSFGWTDTNLLTSPVSFTFVLAYPAGATGGSVVPSVFLRPSSGTRVTLTPATLNYGSVANPAITAHPAGQTVNGGSSVSLTVSATGTAPLAYQWLKGSTPIPGATASTLALNGMQSTDAGSYAVTVSNSVGSVTSNAALLAVTVVPPSITQQPAGAVVNPGASVTLTVAAGGTTPLNFQWRKDGVNVAGATTATLVLNNAHLASAGNYAVVVSNGAGSVTSDAVPLTVTTAPVITAHPSSVSILAGGSATFSVTASGASPLLYQWTRNRATLVGATSASLSFSSVQSSDAGLYAVVVSNGAGAVTSNPATLTVGSAFVAPAISTQPTAVAAVVGGTARFAVIAGGSAPLAYQWRKDGVSVPGATGDAFSLAGVKTSDAGNYTVVVSNPAGADTSSVARLDVATTLVVITPPADQTVPLGAGATFSVVVSGGVGPSTYQWRRNGTPIPGATASQLTVASVQPADAGTYTVVVSNSATTITSAAATLAVSSSRISNLSVRANLENSQTLTVGFVTNGTKQLLVRAIGPGLQPFGVTSGFVADPRMALINQATGAVVAQNEDWTASLAGSFASVGAFALDPGSRDAGLLYPVNGPHTVQVNGSGAGLVLVEVYDADGANAARLRNVSARNQVGTGANVLIAGFVITGTAERMLLIRGIGPALKELFGVTGALVDPKVEIYRQDNTKIIENDDWSPSLLATFDQAGAFRLPAGSKDAAMLVSLPPGVYTAQLSGVGGTSGDGVIEVYEVP